MSHGFLIDTNVPSELTRPQPERRVVRWPEETSDDLMHLSVISIGEICKGFTIHPEYHRRTNLRRWLDDELRPWFAGRILPLSESIAERWGILDGECQLKGLTLHAPDGLIAATALEHDLALVTRNVKDFAGLGIALINPWDEWCDQPHSR
jgi:predicted nucleic acid-binding protein